MSKTPEPDEGRRSLVASSTARDILESTLERVGEMHGWCDQHGRRDTGRICVSHETVSAIEGDLSSAIATLTYGIGDGGSR